MASKVIIFNPGSRNLYFGRSSDSSPQSILHVIARRRKSQLPEHIRKDTILPISEKKLAEKVPHEVESARLQLSLTLQSALRSVEEVNTQQINATKIFLTDIASVASSNKSAKKYPVLANSTSALSNSKELENKQFIVGDEALRMSSDSFNIICPWRRGQLNLNRGVGGSITSVIVDLQDIWMWCLNEKLGIPSKDLNAYKAIVVVPVMFDRVHAKEIMNLLLNNLGFQSGFLVQDHVCATFGCGISCATVMDIGDQKISVSCVEDGVSYPQSRVELKYGGGDLTVALWNQLNLINFPLPIDISQQWDLEFLNQLKEKYCNLDLKSWKSGPREEKILWNKPGQVPTEYSACFGDELLIVPLSYFNPDLLRGSIGRKAVICYGPQPSVSDDPIDRAYLAETSCLRKTDLNEDDDDDTLSDDHSKSLSNAKQLTFEIPIGIDQAISQSIECCNVPNDLKRQWFSCIVLVGGGFKINGLLEWLKERMKSVLLSRFPTDSEENSTEEDLPRIVNSVKNKGDASITTWKGAAILSNLETAKELWISGSDWRKFGSRILREKSLFHY